MTSEGVGGLTVSAVARQLGVKPPSIYKYFDSLIAIYDALFRRGHEANLEVLRRAVASTDAGLSAIRAGLEATGRWAIDNPVVAQLLFFRPVPGYVPTADAYAPTVDIVALLRRELQIACDAGELGAGAASDEAMTLLSTLHFGIISQQLANDPDADWAHGRFTWLLPTMVDLFITAYPPTGAAGPSRAVTR